MLIGNTEPGPTTSQYADPHVPINNQTVDDVERYGEIVEAILLAAQKAGKESDVRNAKDTKDGATPADDVAATPAACPEGHATLTMTVDDTANRTSAA